MLESFMARLNELGLSAVDIADEKVEQGWQDVLLSSAKWREFMKFVVEHMTLSNVMPPEEHNHIEE